MRSEQTEYIEGDERIRAALAPARDELLRFLAPDYNRGRDALSDIAVLSKVQIRKDQLQIEGQYKNNERLKDLSALQKKLTQAIGTKMEEDPQYRDVAYPGAEKIFAFYKQLIEVVKPGIAETQRDWEAAEALLTHLPPKVT